jgi:hypothetical protein
MVGDKMKLNTSMLLGWRNTKVKPDEKESEGSRFGYAEVAASKTGSVKFGSVKVGVIKPT